MKNTKQTHSLQFTTVNCRYEKDMKSLDGFTFLHSLLLTPWVRHLTEEHSQKLKAAAPATPAQLVPNHEEGYVF